MRLLWVCFDPWVWIFILYNKKILCFEVLKHKDINPNDEHWKTRKDRKPYIFPTLKPSLIFKGCAFLPWKISSIFGKIITKFLGLTMAFKYILKIRECFCRCMELLKIGCFSIMWKPILCKYKKWHQTHWLLGWLFNFITISFEK